MILQTNSLTKQYGSYKAVNNVSMNIKEGEIYGFIGQNGAGKTTLIRLITGLIHGQSGEISLFGKSTAEGLSEGRTRIGCIVEAPVFTPYLTAAENLEYHRIQRGIADKSIVQKALQTVHLTETGNKKYKSFSLGMKQRLGLALAIMGSPDFLILDEPINGLDPNGIIEFRSIITELNQKHGMTILISSHILAELSQVATRFGIIHQGQLIKEISREELNEQTKRCYSIKVSDSALAAVVIREKLGTDKFEVYPNNEIRVYEKLDDSSEINFVLNSNGVRVHSATEVGANLEEYFLKLTGKN